MMKISQNKADAGVLKQIEARYDDASKQMGYKVSPPEETINQLAYSLMIRNPDAAFLLFSMNMRNYPGSYNVYDSMGDYYASVKNNLKAIEYYKKALTIKEDKKTRGKLNKLIGGK
jgi:tetratricopeptide (TPR) repeat protein